MIEHEKRPRPYWHVDAKWINGILLFFSLGASLLLYNLSNLTVRDQAVTASASVVASLFSKNGLDDPASVAAFKQQVENLPDDAVITPLSEYPTIHLTKAQVESLSPSDLKIAIFSQLTGLIYDKGLDSAAAELTSDPSAQQTLVSQASPLGLLTQQNHDLLQKLCIVAAVVSVVWLALMVLFSAGWGRLVSPAVVLLAISPIGTVGGLLLLALAASSNPVSTFVPANVLQALSSSLQHSYGIALLVAVGLLVVAAIGKIISGIIARSERNRPAFLKD